jgi:ribose 5-phosphate isomerase B
MKIALCSDEPYPVHDIVREFLAQRGHSVLPFGSFATGGEHPWALAAEQAALAVANCEADEGIFFCWSGTGICMAANKITGVRAALCSDPGQVKAARIWNHANVLCLSNRALSGDMAREILEAWFDTTSGDQGSDGVALLLEVEGRHRNQNTRCAIQVQDGRGL